MNHSAVTQMVVRSIAGLKRAVCVHIDPVARRPVAGGQVSEDGAAAPSDPVPPLP